MPTSDLIQLLSGEPLEEKAERAALQEIAARESAALPQLCRRLLSQRQKLQRDLAKARVEAQQATATLEKIVQPPLFPGLVLRALGGRIDVASGGRRQIAALGPELADEALRPGDEVWLDPVSGIAVARGDTGPRLGRVGVVGERVGERIMVRGPDDEEQSVLCAPALAETLSPGDRILYSAEFPCVLERLPQRQESGFRLEVPPPVRFEDIGGLDDLVAEVRRDLDLHIRHPELVQRYRMASVRGMTLVGPPGVGKTLLVKAIARYLADLDPNTRFLDVPPGSLRAQYYGQTEERIRDLFKTARAAPGLVVIFFDELDHFGARGANVGHEIDDRVLGTLLVELSGLQAAENIFVVGATNRPDLIDEAVLRHGRFGDRIHRIPRPRRQATREILARLLPADLPWEGQGSPEEASDAAAVAATSYLHAPAGGAGTIVRVTLADGSQEEVRAGQILSGALLASSVEQAKKAAAQRELEGGAPLGADDLIEALDEALAAEAQKLAAPAVARRVLEIPRAGEIVRVEVPAERRIGSLARLRAA